MDKEYVGKYFSLYGSVYKCIKQECGYLIIIRYETGHRAYSFDVISELEVKKFLEEGKMVEDKDMEYLYFDENDENYIRFFRKESGDE